jgi:hypothetical protein
MCWLSGEPTLDEMLCDTTVITMMKRDGVAPDDLRVLLLEMSRRLKRHRVSPASPQLLPRVPAHHGRARTPACFTLLHTR